MSLHNHIAALSAIHQLSEIERTIGVKKVYGPDIKRVPRDLAGYPSAGRAQTCEPGIMQSSSPGFPSLLIVIRRRANWEPAFEYLRSARSPALRRGERRWCHILIKVLKGAPVPYSLRGWCHIVLRDAGAIFFALLSAPTALNSGARQNKTRRRIASDESF